MAQLISWCDRLASVPQAGIRLSPEVVAVDALLEVLSPIIAKHFQGDREHFQVEAAELMKLVVNTDEGFRYSLDSIRATVGFNHRIKVQSSSGGLPRMEMISSATTFTDILQECQSRLLSMSERLPKVSSRRLKRYFIVATTHLSHEDLPPGIKAMLNYMSAPWHGQLDSMNLAIRTKVSEGAGYKDYCLHSMTVPDRDSEGELVNLTLDWHREFDPDRASTTAALADIGPDASASCLSYFEQLADGSMFDADLISTL